MLNRKDTQVNLTSPWCTLVTSTLCWANEAMAKGRKTPKINLLWRANNPPSSNDVTETRSEFQKPAHRPYGPLGPKRIGEVNVLHMSLE